MTEATKDTQRTLAALESILDGRDPDKEGSAVLVTLEQLIAVVLLGVMKKDPALAARMLHEGVLPGVEQRLAYYNSRNPR